MGSTELPSFRATFATYLQEAQALLDGLKAGDEAAGWRFKWEHPAFRGRRLPDVRAATLDLGDAQVVVAREHGFESWTKLEEFAKAVAHDGPVARFEEAVEDVVRGDVEALRSMLRAHPELVRERSSRRHHDAGLAAPSPDSPLTHGFWENPAVRRATWGFRGHNFKFPYSYYRRRGAIRDEALRKKCDERALAVINTVG